MRDMRSNIGLVSLLDSAAVTNHTTFASKLLDLQGFEGAVIAVHIAAQAGEDTSNFVTPTLQESDTTVAGDFTDVTDVKDMQGPYTETVADIYVQKNVEAFPNPSPLLVKAVDNSLQFVGYTGGKRYIRINFVFTGTGISSVILGATGIVGLARKKPVTAPAAVSAT